MKNSEGSIQAEYVKEDPWRQAFMSLFTDRMFRGGILAKGSGFLEC